MHMDEDALQVLEGYGYSRKIVKEGLNKGDLNHATASYNLIVMSWFSLYKLNIFDLIFLKIIFNYLF